jgi:predicted RNA binding protein YcfA (HicA-like mRNA interferase family)
MSKHDKLRQRLRDNPKGRTKQEIETLLGHFGFTLDRVSGSHHVFILDDGEARQRIVVPIHGPKIKPIYIKQVIEEIDRLFPEQDNSEEEDDE